MRRAKRNHGLIITIITVGTGIICAIGLTIGVILPLHASGRESKTTYNENSYAQSDSIETSENTPVEIVSETDQTLNQTDSSRISASKQSSLEKAIEDLIILTETE